MSCIPFWTCALWLTIACAVSLPGPASAQEIIKPTGGAAAGRLPAPRSVVARQLPDGRIQLTWGTVPDAASYQITRSVPPEPMRVVSDPDPTDTLFLDQDVTPGKSYYYMVAAVSEGGGTGLKAGTAPVLARSAGDTSTSVAAGSTDTAATKGALAAPQYFTAEAFPYPYVTFYWSYPEPNMAFVIERALMTGGQKSALNWQFRLRTPQLPCCSMIATDKSDDLDRSAYAIYRVTAIDPASPGRKSPEKRSEFIHPMLRSSSIATPQHFDLPPVRVDGTITLKVGQTRGTGMNDNELHHMMIMDTTVLAMSPYNYYKAKAPGVTFIIKSLQQKDGAPYLWAERVTVLP